MNDEMEKISENSEHEISEDSLISEIAPDNGSDSEAPAETYSPIDTESAAEAEPDYGKLLDADMRELSREFKADGSIKVTDLKNPVRYGALRDLGLTPREAYLASGGKRERPDNRAHLSSSVPRAMTSAFSEIPRSELEAARELFSDMSDSEIRALYKKVTQ